MQPINFYDLTLADLEKEISGLGKEKFRARQLFQWVHGRGVRDFAAMTDLAKDFRAQLPNLFEMGLPKVVSNLLSTDGTRKFLLDVGDGLTIEAVVIPSEGRLTLCVSSEVGCNLGCKFCFTAKQKLKRRLTAGEIVGQYIVASQFVPEGQRISNIVFMGMGEPLDNPDAVFKSIEILHNPLGANLSRRKITVSTSGIVPMISRVTEAGVRLAVSLNGVNDQVRSQIMPVNKKWPLAELLDACRAHARATNDLVTMEYVLLKGVTDSLEDAAQLHELAKTVPCKINIIPFNEHPGSGFLRPSNTRIDRFHKEMMRLGTHVLRRKTMGRDIYAACGQLNSLSDKHPTRMSV